MTKNISLSQTSCPIQNAYFTIVQILRRFGITEFIGLSPDFKTGESISYKY